MRLGAACWQFSANDVRRKIAKTGGNGDGTCSQDQLKVEAAASMTNRIGAVGNAAGERA